MHYIDVESRLRHLKSILKISDLTLYQRSAVEFAIWCIETSPKVAIDRPKGTWELHSDGSATCSHCKRTSVCVWDYDNYQRYFGDCGAEMSLKSEEEYKEKSFLDKARRVLSSLLR